MAILEIIYLIVKIGLAGVPLISEIYDLIKKLYSHSDAPALKAEVQSAVAEYKKTKDMRPLRDLRDRLYKKCDEACL
jgi:hypothetical protein